ncbi:MAG: TetR/AcrR family transcriptional regulator [Acidimicrobiales bacterium]|nr:TetR/AcrR family transcriptional regulator [Acidimicrobiales bacterium]
MADDELTSASATRLVLTAERLFALYGIEGVSLRQISLDSGSSNNSAVHYYFGSKDGLIEAILRHRVPQLLAERRLLASQSDPTDIRSLFSAHYLPLLHMADDPDNHYVTFVEQLQRRDLAAGIGSFALPDEGKHADALFRQTLEPLLVDLDPRLRASRVVQAQLLCLHAAADREHANAGGNEVEPLDLFVSSLLDGITGFLQAPATNPTLRRLDSLT